MEFDRTDRQLLNLLQKNNRITNARLADLVGLSPPACLQRLKRLRSCGVIRREVALLEPESAGQMMTMIVEIELERDRPELQKPFLQAIGDAPEVTQCYQVTGEVDVVLVVSVTDIRAFEDFVHRVLYAEPNMRKFRTLISLKRHKFETAIQF